MQEKQNQRLRKEYEFDEKINKNDRKPTLKKYNISDLIYNANHSFYKYRDIKEFDNLSLESKYSSFLANLFNDLDKFNKLKLQKKKKRQICIMQLQNYIMTC